MLLVLAFLMGIIAGLRSMTAPAAISWGAALGHIAVGDSWASFLGATITPWIFTVLALGEFVTDQLPQTPSRKVPVQFGGRIVSGAFCGAVLGTAGGSLVGGLVAGALGAIIGTLGGAAARGWLAARFHNDRPAALIEDAVAIVGAALIVSAAG
ncbi:DUF4126 domain-containing protein [Aurantimonas sp. MSK8Z-1]|uniref:DUF4126 domain-containing protein n=1 Tax=Mangrovibrevibacter kandeliae TaxID=2968473 RepID=UPI00211857EA|nr:DUF4126 domain-containing protein [Aurantimonas sp. MSK8Z-1]MCW4116859.1 DUF4126 domain-containing protein [Aurantimonas sp. MSK8Z-1]